MENKFCTYPLTQVNAELIAVAQGEKPAELVIKNATLVNVCTKEILEHTDIAISKGRIAYIGLAPYTADHCIGKDTDVIDATGLFAAPGFLDGHIHVESSMVEPAEFARATVAHGTVGIFCDPHEIANVCGLEGIKEMARAAKRTPLKQMVTTPSCVPAVPGFEDTGASINAQDIAQTMTWDEVVGLGEMMNFPGILAQNQEAIDEVNVTLDAQKCVTGHYSMPEHDRGLNAYIASGISACHESTTADEVLTKIRLGMYAQLREGSAWHNLKDLLPAILHKDIDTRFCCLVTDDAHPRTLLKEGHIDRILRYAVSLGLDPVVALQMVSINTATCFKLDHEMGSITPGKCADIVLLEDLNSFKVTHTFIDGVLAAKEGNVLFDVKPYQWSDGILHTMHIARHITKDTFTIPAKKSDGTPVTNSEASVRVMKMSGGDTLSKHIIAKVPVVNGALVPKPGSDILKVFVFERHHGTETYAAGFAQGFKIHGALAQTVAHDAHNLIVMGDNDDDMALAAQTLIDCGGGEVAIQDGKILGLVKLPIAGLMSLKNVDVCAEEVENIEEAWKKMGCAMPSPFMTMAAMSLACIPELRLTNKGYVNCLTFEFEDLICD